MNENLTFDFTYYHIIEKQLKDIVQTEHKTLMAASQLIARAIYDDGLIHIFGTGHSHIFAEEAFYRAGGLACVNPMLEPSLMLHCGAMKSSALEDLDGYAEKVFNHFHPELKDVFILFSNSGVNLVPYQMAQKVRQNGTPLIAIGSKKYMSYLKENKKRPSIQEVASVFIDNHSDIGDASIALPGFDQKIAPTSTIAGAFILNLILANASRYLIVKEKIVPPVFVSGNLPEGKQKNSELYHTYRQRVKML